MEVVLSSYAVVSMRLFAVGGLEHRKSCGVGGRWGGEGEGEGGLCERVRTWFMGALRWINGCVSVWLATRSSASQAKQSTL